MHESVDFFFISSSVSLATLIADEMLVVLTLDDDLNRLVVFRFKFCLHLATFDGTKPNERMKQIKNRYERKTLH